MFSTFAYEIGAVFLLAALLMYGTVSGLIPRALRAGKPAPIVLGVALLGFAIYHFGPDLYAGWLSIGEPSLTAARPSPAGTTPALRLVKSAASKANTQRRPVSGWKTVVLNDSVPAPTETAPPVGKPIEDPGANPAVQPSAPTERTDTTPAVESSALTGETGRAAAESCCNSPYDSGAKRAIKSIGHFLHIGQKKEQNPR